MPILCSVVFSQTQGKTAKKVRIDFFTANIDSGYQSCVCFNEKFSPYPKRKKKKCKNTSSTYRSEDGPLSIVGPYKAKEHSALLLMKLPLFCCIFHKCSC